ncbi:hypothetical protein [Sphingobacterium sp. 1.A.5]|uniref:hypothetical protein n=1 Tax=Sphingobacterium sp. 1.A.5 TaxID=2044604 RepID=UPI000C0C05D2|nr:hypothetical protein [Sphingobacterium sp. 1.A.5]
MEENKREILINVKVDNQNAIQSTEALKKKFGELTQAVDKYKDIELNQINVNELEIALNQAKNLFKQLSASGLASVGDLKNVSAEIQTLNQKIAEVKNIDIKVNANVDDIKGRLDDLKNIDLPNVSLDNLNYEIEKSQRLFQDIFQLNDSDSEQMMSELMTVMDNINGQIQGITVPVDINTSEALADTDALKRRFQDLSNVALSFDSIDFDNSSIGELRDHLNQANNVFKQLKASGLATDQQLDDVAKTITKLKGTISGMKIENAFKGFESSIHGVVGVGQILESTMVSLGIESETAEKSIQKMMALMTLKDGVESLGKYVEGMKAMVTGTNGATSATKLLKISLASIGIGLVITAVSYLVENWESLSATVKEFFPAIDGISSKFTNFSAIAEGVGKAVVGFIVRPIQGAIKAFNMFKEGDWKGAGKEILTAFNPIERVGNVIKDFKSGYGQGIIKKEATDNIKKFNDESEKTIKILEATGGKEKEIFATKKKMWQNEIDQLKSKNKVLSSADQKRVDELTDMMEIEGIKHNKFVKDQVKSTASAVDNGLKEIKDAVAEASKYISDLAKTERQKEVDDIDAHYSTLIAKAKKYGQDVATLEKAKESKIAEINKKYDLEDNEKKLTEIETKGQTDLLNAKTGNEGKTVEDLNKVANVELKNAKDSYEQKKILAKDNAVDLAKIEAEYANEVYNINKGLTDSIKALKDKELQDTVDKVTTIQETNVLNVQNEINESEKGLPSNEAKPLTDEEIQLVLDNVDKLHNAKIEQLRLNYEQERLLYIENAEKLAQIDAKFKNDLVQAEKDASDKKIEINQNQTQKKMDSENLYFDASNQLLEASKVISEENTLWQKSLAVAQATMNAYLAGSQVLKDPFFVGRPWERVIAMSGIIATGLANVYKIVNTKVNNKTGSTGGNNISAPQINVTQLQPKQTQDVRVIENQSQTKQEPVKAYIVNKDLETQKEKDAFAESYSKI